jgi:4-amino-4-deoxy-L-arabinose transferase-like glycosyltransferase
LNLRFYFWAILVLSAILLLAPLRTGDLPGYDDALYAHIAKDILRTGDWINIRSNGYPALEHPPLLAWSEAALFSIFGVSDAMARLPAALSGLGVIALSYWLAKKLLRDRWLALLAMFVMATSVYFLKYAAHAMTDVPFTFLFLCAVSAWVLAEEEPRWYLVAGLFTALAGFTRSMMGFSLPLLFAADCLVRRKLPPWRWILPALTIAILPAAAWYGHLMRVHRDFFVQVHSLFLEHEVFGALNPAWRRYTGAPEYLWMIVKGYWPWLPFFVTGFVLVIRERRRDLYLLVAWIAVVFVLCSVARSRILRYMLPAFPAFAMLSAIGLTKLVPDRYLRNSLRVLVPLFGLVALVVAIRQPRHWNAVDVRPMAAAATSATAPGERFVFYDEGQPRWDETNQLQWYGERNLIAFLERSKLDEALQQRTARVFVVDRATYDSISGRVKHEVVAASGHLVCFRLADSVSSQALLFGGT